LDLLLVDENKIYSNSTDISIGTYAVEVWLSDDDSKQTGTIQEAVLEFDIIVYTLEFD